MHATPPLAPSSSYAAKLRTTFQLGPTMRTAPSRPPRNRLSEPQQRADTTSWLSSRARVSSVPGAVSGIWDASKKSKDRH